MTLFFMHATLLSSQEDIPDLTLKIYKGESFQLADSLDKDKNYILLTTAHWCGWCKRALKDWKECYLDWDCQFDLEIIALSSDGLSESEQYSTLKYLRDNGLPYKLWIAEPTALYNAFVISAYPTSILISKNQKHIHSLRGYRNCESMTDSLRNYFPSDIYQDIDMDGFSGCLDCNDDDPEINPSNQEIPYNGVDDDCNPQTKDDDLDNDGYPLASDCDDLNSNINPDADEICNEIDDNCDGETDEGYEMIQYWFDNDRDGYGNIDYPKSSCSPPDRYVTNADDCNDYQKKIYPGAEEIPNNGIDEDCNGEDLVISAVSNITKTELDVYPNPARNIVYTNLFDLNQYDIVAISIRGSIHRLYCYDSAIDISQLTPGVYLLEVRKKRSSLSLSQKLIVAP